MINMLVAAVLSTSTIDLEAGTVVCRSESTAAAYVQTRHESAASTVDWLDGSACHALPRDFPGQRVLGNAEGMLIVEWTNGRFRKVRYVPQGV